MEIIDNRGTASGSLFINGRDHFYVLAAGRTHYQAVLEQLHNLNTESDLAALGHAVTAIPGDGINRVKTNIHSRIIEVEYYTRKGNRRELAHAHLVCQDRATVHTVLEHLHRHRPDFSLSQTQYTAARAARTPALLFLLFTLTTAASARLAAILSSGNSGAIQAAKGTALWAFYPIAHHLGLAGSLALGGVLSVGLGIWLVLRIKTPPLMYVLERQKAG